MKFIFRILTHVCAVGFLGLAVHDTCDCNYPRGFAWLLSSLLVYAHRTAPMNNPKEEGGQQQRLLPVFLTALVLGFGGDSVQSTQLPASPFTLESPVCEPAPNRCGRCTKDCICGCQRGEECDCIDLLCEPGSPCGCCGDVCPCKARKHLERPYNWLPDEKTCEREYNAASERIGNLRGILRGTYGEPVVMPPVWHKDHGAAEGYANSLRKSIAEEEHLAKIWYAAWWVAYDRQNPVADRAGWAKTLRELVGDAAYFSGKLPK